MKKVLWISGIVIFSVFIYFLMNHKSVNEDQVKVIYKSVVPEKANKNRAKNAIVPKDITQNSDITTDTSSQTDSSAPKDISSNLDSPLVENDPLENLLSEESLNKKDSDIKREEAPVGKNSVDNHTPKFLIGDPTSLTEEEIRHIVAINRKRVAERYNNNPDMHSLLNMLPRILRKESLSPEESLKLMESFNAINPSADNRKGLQIMRERVKEHSTQ